MAGRVSTAQMFSAAQSHVAKTQERFNTSAEKAGTQKEIIKPSQNPSGWVTAANLKDDVSLRETLVKNAGVANHVLKATETIFEQAQDHLHRAYELVISQSGTPLSGPAGAQGVLAEVEGIYDGLLQVLNFKYGSRTLLAGFNSQGPAFDRQGNFLGDSGVIEIDLDRQTRLPLTVSAEKVVLGRGSPDGVNILGAFQTLMEGLRTGNQELVHAAIEPIRQGIEQLSEARAELGARMHTLERALDRHTTQNISNLETISRIEDADAIKVFSDLARDQTILHAAIKASQKVLSENTGEILFD